jgi:hypothetical protein
VQAAARGDVAEVEKAAKDLAGKQAAFGAKTNQAAAKLKSPERKAQATAAVDDVANLVPKLVSAAKQLAQNPKDQPAHKQLLNLNRYWDRGIIFWKPLTQYCYFRVADDGLKLAKNAVKHNRAVKDAQAPEKADRRLKLCGVRGHSPTEDAEVLYLFLTLHYVSNFIIGSSKAKGLRPPARCTCERRAT